ncbi:hypothetical protein L208DRAFT_1122039, partial [Tricholoma matsutake]
STLPILGEALAYYELVQEKQFLFLVVYRPLINQEAVLKVGWKGNWSDEIKVMPVDRMIDKVAVW